MNDRKNILVIDDDSVAHFIMDKTLAAFTGLNKIYGACNGKEALQFLENYCKGLIKIPDLIILDLHMPVMDGFQFIETYKTNNCLMSSQAVIAVLSSSENPNEKARLHSLGIEHIISKPISIEKLNNLLKVFPSLSEYCRE